MSLNVTVNRNFRHSFAETYENTFTILKLKFEELGSHAIGPYFRLFKNSYKTFFRKFKIISLSNIYIENVM